MPGRGMDRKENRMLIFLIIIVVIAAWIVAIYNNLIVLRNRIENAWSRVCYPGLGARSCPPACSR